MAEKRRRPDRQEAAPPDSPPPPEPPVAEPEAASWTTTEWTLFAILCGVAFLVGFTLIRLLLR